MSYSFEELVSKIKLYFPSSTDREARDQAKVEYSRFLEEEVGRTQMWVLQNLLRQLGLKSSFIYQDWPDNERFHASQYQRRVKFHE